MILHITAGLIVGSMIATGLLLCCLAVAGRADREIERYHQQKDQDR